MKYLFLRFCFISFSIVINAQESNSLRLKLVDQAGGLIEHAAAVLKNKKIEVTEQIGSQAGIIEFSSLTDGNYTLTIKSNGFKDESRLIEIKKGKNNLEIKLEIEQINEQVVVEMSAREKRFSEAINKVFSAREIEELPDDPEAIQRVLKQRYGNDAVMRVNGFTGGQFPDKSQIASISVILSPIDAEFHYIARATIDITTKVSKTKKWSGFASFNIGDSRLNARNAFSRTKQPFQNENFYFSLTPPSFGKNTGILLTLSGTNRRSESIFLGKIPFPVESNNRNETDLTLSPSITLNQNLNKNNTLYVNYEYGRNQSANNGLGTFDISERAYSTIYISNSLKLSEAATIGGYSNQLRFKFDRTTSQTNPNSSEPSIIIPGFFNEGGAGNKSDSISNNGNITDILTFTKNGHLIKAGGEIGYGNIVYNFSTNTNGQFTFSNINDFLQNKPLLYSQRNKISSSSFAQYETALFLQDYFSVTKNLQFGIGGRWEFQSKANDYNNFAPRLSLVWSPEKTGKLILRGGFGSLYNSLDSKFYSSVLSDDGTSSSEIKIINPGFPNPFDNGIIATQIEKPGIRKLGKIINSDIYASFFAAVFTPTDHFKFAGSYISIRGNHLPRIRDLNYFVEGVRPDPNFGSVYLYEFAGNSRVDGVLSTAEIKIRGFIVNTNYTFTKSTVDFNDDGLPTDNSNLRADAGLTDDRKHELDINTQFLLSRILRLKFFRSFRINLDFSAKSGLPYTITTGYDNNNDGVINDRPAGIARNSEYGDYNFQTDLRINWKPKIGDIGKSNFLSTLNSLNFTVEVKNLFNQTNLQNYIGIQTSPFFRQPTYAGFPRNIQFGVNYVF